MYNLYINVYGKWIRIFRWLCDKCEPTQKVKNLIEKVKYHLWKIEWRMLCFKWFDKDAENSELYPKTLR